MIAPIETTYKGYNFRSRLEARWGIFLDQMGVPWEYEVQGFETEDGQRYLPDFRVQSRIGVLATDAGMEQRKAEFEGRGLSEWSESVSRLPKSQWDSDLSILTPATWEYTWLEVKPRQVLLETDRKKLASFVQSSQSDLLLCTGDPYDNDLFWLSCDGKRWVSGQAAIIYASSPFLMLLVRGAGCDLERFYRVANEFRKHILPAATLARSARFEHGATP